MLCVSFLGSAIKGTIHPDVILISFSVLRWLRIPVHETSRWGYLLVQDPVSSICGWQLVLHLNLKPGRWCHWCPVLVSGVRRGLDGVEQLRINLIKTEYLCLFGIPNLFLVLDKVALSLMHNLRVTWDAQKSRWQLHPSVPSHSFIWHASFICFWIRNP